MRLSGKTIHTTADQYNQKRLKKIFNKDKSYNKREFTQKMLENTEYSGGGKASDTLNRAKKYISDFYQSLMKREEMNPYPANEDLLMENNYSNVQVAYIDLVTHLKKRFKNK